MMSAGHAENALPQSATATVNCRLLPVDKAGDVERTLGQVLADPKITISTVRPPNPVPYKAIDSQVLAVVTAATAKFWPGIPVIPRMDTGASDGIYLIGAGMPTYGISGIFGDEDDVRAHGRDERVLVQSFYQAVDFMYTLVTALGKGE
jgi:acetylornithine deacetylase/succinyl-diaminopimelate desuccinylase-like protein